MNSQQYPEQYLHVEDCRNGETWIVPIADDERLDLEALTDKWIAAQYGNELVRVGRMMPCLAGNYYARIMTDNRSPQSAVCWTSGGFYLKEADADIEAGKAGAR